MILDALFERRSSDDQSSWLRNLIGTESKSVSGESVNESSSMALSAYFASIRAISEDVAKLPLFVYKRLQPRGKERVGQSDTVQQILHDAANEEMSAMSFRETITAHALGYHGGFAEIVRDGAGRAVALWPLDPTRVKVDRDVDRNLVYVVTNDSGGTVILQQRQVFHIHGLGFDGITGYVVSRIARESIGAALAAQKFRGSFFGNGATTTGILEVPQVLEDKALKHLRDSFAERYSGSANTYKPIVLEQGTKFTPTSNDPEKSQLVETMQFGVEDVARWFRIPLSKVQHLLKSANFNSLEQLNTAYIVDTLTGWTVRWEQEIKRKLLPTRKDHFAEHLFNALLRGDQAARSTFYREQFNIGALSQNDIRELENQNPIENGDVYYVNASMVPSDLAAQGPSPETEPGPVSIPENRDADNQDESDESIDRMARAIDRVAKAHIKPLAYVLRRLLMVEASKAKRACKKGGLVEWMLRFYPDHVEEVRSAIIPVVDSFCESVCAMAGILTTDNIRSRICTATSVIAENHVDLSVNEIKESGIVAIDSWTTERAIGAADNEMILLSELMKELIHET